MKANFDACLAATLKWEGGYVDNPRDPGGATNMGITRKTLAAWRHVSPWTSLPKSAVKSLTRAEAASIYRANFWNAVSADDLPSGVDLTVFDFSVNSGPSRAAEYLQAVLGVKADGKIGPVTLKAAGTADAHHVVNALCDRRIAFLEKLSTFSAFGGGWTSRVKSIRATALALSGK